MVSKTVAVLGASEDRAKFGNKSVRAHLMRGYTVFPVNPNANSVERLEAYPTIKDVPVEHLDRVSIYLRPQITLEVLEQIAEKGCDEVWLNPGTADEQVLDKARELGLKTVQGCSIVDLGLSPEQFPS